MSLKKDELQELTSFSISRDHKRTNVHDTEIPLPETKLRKTLSFAEVEKRKASSERISRRSLFSLGWMFRR